MQKYSKHYSIVFCLTKRPKILFLEIKHQAPVVQRLDNAIHWINRYPADKS